MFPYITVCYHCQEKYTLLQDQCRILVTYSRLAGQSRIGTEVQPNTAVLVGCEKALTNDLQQGMRVKAAYEVKDGRNVARVIEAEKK